MLRLPEFEDITYLKHGSPIQRLAYNTLYNSKILYHLQPFNAIVTGTIPLDLFIEGKSDIDIICCCAHFPIVEKIISQNFKHLPGYTAIKEIIRNVETLVINFSLTAAFPIEIFCQANPTRSQFAYRHMVVEYQLLEKYGEDFRKEVMKLKRTGMKTEPAFAKLLGLVGDPYESLLSLENEV